MLINYLRIAFRNIRRNKLYSLINISCLAIGIAVAMTILLYVLHEHSYDRWQANAQRIFSLSGSSKVGNSSFNYERFSYPTGPLVQKADGNVEGYLRVFIPFQKPMVQTGAGQGTRFTVEKPFLFADADFFRFFSFRLISGNAAAVLVRPYTVVLSASAARKYFGDSDPIGKTLTYNKDYRLEVTGVCADPPSNSTIDYEMIASLSSTSTMKEMQGLLKSQTVQGGGFKTWLLLKNPGSSRNVEQTLVRLSRQPGDEDGQDTYQLTALPDIHLNNNFGDWSNTRYLQIFPLAAGLILLLALVNYMSLATARAAIRAKEVGVRKVMGAGRGRIASQFYTESAVYALLSFAAGTGLFLLFRPYFLNLLQLKIDSAFLGSPQVLFLFGGLLLLVTAISGSYPSLVLSAFRPVAVLYGKMSRRRGTERIRKGFLVFQFAISMSLVLCSVIIGKELYFIRHSDTGVDRENVIMIPFGTTLPHYQAFKREVQALSGIRQAATAHYPMYKGYDAFFTSPKAGEKPVMLPVMSVDNDFITLLGLQWQRQPATPGELYDDDHIVLNETAIDKLGLQSDPIGQKVGMGNKDYSIAGVLRDFNYQSLQEKIGALCLFVSKDTASAWGTTVNGCLFGKIQPRTNLPTLIEELKKIYIKYDRETPFNYQFMDDAFNNQYKAEDRLAALFSIFTVFTICIGCLGLFALATFSAQQRVKEIGIRKVLGASVGSIGALLSKDFLRPVLLAVLIACPLSWWLMNKWLEDFAYRTSLPWWLFAAAGLGLLLVALATVLARSWQAGRANPVDNLRAE